MAGLLVNRTARLGALSLFLLLAGVGRLVVAPPGGSALFTTLLIAAALALVPLWWRDAVGRGPIAERLEEPAPAPAGELPGGPD